jgi:hypothetical protein
MFPEVAVVLPNAAPLILPTVVTPWVPVISPSKAPEKLADVPEISMVYVPEFILDEKSPAVSEDAVSPAMAVLETDVTRPWASVVNTGTELADPYVPDDPVFFKVNTPVLLIVASPDKACVTQLVPFANNRLPDVAVVVPNTAPFILATVVDACVPVTSPANEPVNAPAFPDTLIEYVPEFIFDEKSPALSEDAVSPAIAVLTTDVTRPWASVVNTGTELPEPYVPDDPEFFSVSTPPLVMVASPERAWVTQLVPFPSSRFPDVAVVVPKTAPLILATVVEPIVPLKSPPTATPETGIPEAAVS